ncbi:Nitronate monooxygenase [Cladobotryum mycophilum]|uniref:Nitronate monooxygenase n=1 Tax=Cladobotryum mycophilum TaxID=491253 RepID=A0ABR0S4R9_9HYPO
MSASRLQEWFPWLEAPIVVSAPMAFAATPQLAVEVTKAGGFGFLSSYIDLSEGSPHLAALDSDLTYCREHLGDAPDKPTRVGASFLTGHASITKFSETALPLIQKHKPAAVWLFAPKVAVKPHGLIIKALKGLDVPPKVFVQVGNATAAREAIEDGADVLVCQGIDAGGHQYQRGMGVVPLLLEVRRLLEAEYKDRDFTVANESVYPDFRKQQIIQAKDGGSSTLKSPFHDHIGNHELFWGHAYDGRALVGPLHEKYLASTSFEECRRSLKEDFSAEEAEKVINTWAGTAVGIINKSQPAGEIVREVREEAKQAIRKVAGLL